MKPKLIFICGDRTGLRGYNMASDEYGTPQVLYDLLDQEFEFEWDAAASVSNHKCAHYWTKEQNALDRDDTPLRYWHDMVSGPG